MAVITLAECKSILGIVDQSDLLLSGDTTAGSDIIINVNSTSGVVVGNGISGVGIPASSAVSSVPAGGTTLVIDASASVSTVGVALLVFDRGSIYDAKISLFIPLVEEFINRYCNETFDDSSNPWPDTLKVPAAQMIWQNIQNVKANGVVQSETLGDYSASYASAGDAGSYPIHILKTLSMFRRPVFI